MQPGAVGVVVVGELLEELLRDCSMNCLVLLSGLEAARRSVGLRCRCRWMSRPGSCRGNYRSELLAKAGVRRVVHRLRRGRVLFRGAFPDHRHR